MAYRNLLGADNFFETASKEELIDFLIKKINSEVEKGDGADCDLIRECSDWLDELTQDEIVFTPEELERNLEKIKAKVMSDKPIKKRKKMSVKTFVRIALIAAVIFTISILSLSAVAVNKGYSSAWEYVSENIGKIFGLNDGEMFEETGITIIKNTDSVSYKNMEALLATEKLNILYPDNMPNGIKIKCIYYVAEDNNKFVLKLIMSDDSCNISIRNYYYTNKAILQSIERTTINGVDFYIVQKDNSSSHAICQYNGFEYTIQCDKYDNLLMIINNLKG